MNTPNVLAAALAVLFVFGLVVFRLAFGASQLAAGSALGRFKLPKSLAAVALWRPSSHVDRASSIMDLRYPVGKCEYPAIVSLAARQRDIDTLDAAPSRLREAVQGLTDTHLDTPYRPDGWTVRQLVHHLADSHMNGCERFRLALTEDEPTVKTYDEAKWASLADYSGPVEPSLRLIDSLHQRWVALLKSLSDSDFGRRLRHPELGVLRLDTYLASYAWHCRHHTTHITSLRERMNWK